MINMKKHNVELSNHINAHESGHMHTHVHGLNFNPNMTRFDFSMFYFETRAWTQHMEMLFGKNQTKPNHNRVTPLKFSVSPSNLGRSQK